MAKERYHEWESKDGQLICLACHKSGNGVINLDQKTCCGSDDDLSEAIIEVSSHPAEESQMALLEA